MPNESVHLYYEIFQESFVKLLYIMESIVYAEAMIVLNIKESCSPD